MQLFPNWRIFDFSIIQIELLSNIYEQFLKEDIVGKKKSTCTVEKAIFEVEPNISPHSALLL